MARDTITVTSTVRAGVAPALLAPNSGNNAEMANDGRTLFLFINGMGAVSAQATAVTIQQVEDPYGRIQNDAAFIAAINVLSVYGPFPPLLYSQSDENVQIDYDAVHADARVCGIHVAGG